MIGQMPAELIRLNYAGYRVVCGAGKGNVYWREHTCDSRAGNDRQSDGDGVFTQGGLMLERCRANMYTARMRVHTIPSGPMPDIHTHNTRIRYIMACGT